jgi:hypothetical protein
VRLPPACPAIGGGTSKIPTYEGTAELLICWGCGNWLSVVERAVDEIFQAEPELFSWQTSKGRSIEASDVRGYRFVKIFLAALSDDLGLCPGCRRDLGSSRPSEEVQ